MIQVLLIIMLSMTSTYAQPSNPPVILQQHTTTMHKYHMRIDPFVPSGYGVFIGDSIVQGLATSTVFPCSVNYGIGGITTHELNVLIDNYKSISRASFVILLVGVNDFHLGVSSGINARMKQLFSAIDPGRPLIINSVMPAERPTISLQSILDFNKHLKMMCRKRKGCEFIDTWGFLTKENEVIKSDFTDGVHLSASGYDKWILALQKSINRASPSAKIECARRLSYE